MRDWKKRFIAAGILLVISIIILIIRLNFYKEEAASMSDAEVAGSREELLDALEKDGTVYAKGTIDASLDLDEVSLNDGVLSKEPDDLLAGQEPFLYGEYMGIEASVGNYEYDKEKYESNRIMEHHFYAKSRELVYVDSVSVLDVEIAVGESKNLFKKMAVLKQRIGEGSLLYDTDFGTYIPSPEMPDEKFFRGFEIYGYPSEVEGALKLVIEDGEILPEETMILPAAELEIIEELSATGTMDYGVEIGAIVIMWILFTLITWGVMRIFGY